MGFSCGIVGLPNAGKSTLFNALLGALQAQAANYPFCTIEPNKGNVSVPDERLNKLAALSQSQKIIPTYLTFVDIAGLVKGAHKGEGLGNQFLGHIRDTDLIVHVVRCYEDDNINHVNGRVDPLSDLETIETELMLADLASLERQKMTLTKRLRGGDKEAKICMELIEEALILLRDGLPARNLEVSEEQQQAWKSLQLITSKKALYVCNTNEKGLKTNNAFVEEVLKHKPHALIVSAKLEEELIGLSTEERLEYLQTLGIERDALTSLLQVGYHALDFITYFTAGPKEARAWTILRGTKAPQAARVIHSDFEKGFIRAQTISYQDFINCGGEQEAKLAGKMRLEGKDYIVQDGDILHFRFNA